MGGSSSLAGSGAQSMGGVFGSMGGVIGHTPPLGGGVSSTGGGSLQLGSSPPIAGPMGGGGGGVVAMAMSNVPKPPERIDSLAHPPDIPPELQGVSVKDLVKALGKIYLRLYNIMQNAKTLYVSSS